MDAHRKIVAQNVLTFRKKLSWSQEDLAEKADMHWTYISGVERGRYNISLASIVKLSKALGKKPYELLK